MAIRSSKLDGSMPPKRKLVKPQNKTTGPAQQRRQTAALPLVIPSLPFTHLHPVPSSPPPSRSPTPPPPPPPIQPLREVPCSEPVQLPGQQLLPGQGEGRGIMVQQQRELELMITELQERDAELNSLVEIQQRQASVWAEDRQKMLQLEQKCKQLQAVKQGTDQELNQVKTSLTELQCREREAAATLHTLQLRLKSSESERKKLASLCKSMERCVGESKEREVRLQERVSLLESGLREVQNRLAVVGQERDESTAKLKVVQKGAEERERQLETLHTQQRRTEGELARKEEELLKVRQEKEALHTTLVTSSVELEQLKTEIRMAGECDKRKEKLLQLQRSKLERHMRELDTLKKMCHHQDEQIVSLKKQIQDADALPLLPRQPQPQELVGSEVDKLTDLLEDVGRGVALAGCDGRDTEIESDCEGRQEPSSTTVFHTSPQSPVKTHHQVYPQPIHSRTAIVPPQTVTRSHERAEFLASTSKQLSPQNSCNSSLNLNVDHLAQEVRERMACMFDHHNLT